MEVLVSHSVHQFMNVLLVGLAEIVNAFPCARLEACSHVAKIEVRVFHVIRLGAGSLSCFGGASKHPKQSKPKHVQPNGKVTSNSMAGTSTS
jgi:hypothetical protein